MKAETIAMDESDLTNNYRRYLAAIVLFHQAAADMSGLSGADFQASNLLDVDGPLTNGELAHRLNMSTGATTRLVDRLIAAGIVDRRTDPADRRRAVVRHTGVMPRGLDGVLARVRAPIGEAIEGMTPEQVSGVECYFAAATDAYTVAARRLVEDG